MQNFTIKLFLKITVTCVLIGAIIWYVGDLGEIGRVMLTMSPLYLGIAFLIQTADRALMTYKWCLLLQSQGMVLPFFAGMKIYCASMVWGMFLPATVGSDMIRAYGTTRTGLNVDHVIASIIIERMIGFLCALVLGLLSLLLFFTLGFLDNHFFMLLCGSALLLGATVAFATSFSHRVYCLLHERFLCRFREFRIMQRLQKFHYSYLEYQNDKVSIAKFFALTFSEQFLPILFVWSLVLGIGLDVSLVVFAGVVPLTVLIARFPISLNGIGVYEGIFIFLMSFVGVSATEALSIGIIGYIVEVAVILPWWLVHVIGIGSVRTPPPTVELS